ncbi:MAG TPA: tetratricopeptide repeat protein, partial [Kofleriaceae bacterium]
MESVELDPEDLEFDPTDTAPEQRPSRMPAGTIAPPTGELENLRSQARRFRASESWGELSRTLRRMVDICELQDVVDEDETIELYAQLGQLEADVIGNLDEAIDAWRKVIAIDPSELRALAALEDLLAREARWDELVDVLEKRALVLDDDAERRDTLLQAASIAEDKLADATRAAEIYERVRRAEPADELAGERLVAVYRQQGKWTELVDMLLEQAESGEIAQQIQVLHEVAAIYEHEIGEQESAFFVLQAAYTRDTAHEPTLRELERVATAASLWPDLLEEYGKHAGTSADAWAKIGRSYIDELANFDLAGQAVQQALRIDAHHAGALAANAELQRKRGNWNALGETLSRQAAIEASPQKKAQLYLQMAESIERQQQDVAGAIHAYQQALQCDSSSRPALDGIERLYRKTQAWEPLATVLAHRAALSTDEAEIVRTRLELGSIWNERLGDATQAIAAYEQVLELEPANVAALRALETLHETAGSADRFLAVLEAQLDIARGDLERVAIYERMASALEERFGNLERAAETYEKIIAIDPRNNATYHLLERIYQQAGSYESLVDTYRNHARATSEVASRIAIYVAMGEVYETKLHDVDRAIEAYNDALSLDGDEDHALAALGRLYEQLGEWDHTIHVLGRLVDVCDDARKHEVYLKLGHIHYSQLGDGDAAETSWLRGLAVAPAHLPTMDALTRQYSDRGDWLKAAQMMTRAETHTSLAVDKVRLLFAAASVYRNQLRADDQAKQLFAAVIALDPEHVDAGRPLADLYFAAEQWRELSPVIEMLSRKSGESELYYRAARCADELGDYQRALAHYKAAYDLDPGHLPTLLGRADLLFKQSDWASAGKLYQTIMVDHRDGLGQPEVVRVYGRLGKVRVALGERKKALGMFEKALELDPHDRELLVAVVDLQTQLGDWEAVVRAKRALIETADEREHAKLLDETAAIFRDRLHHPQKATAIYLEALELAPEDRQLLQKVLDLFIDTKQWRRAVEIMERFVGLETDAFKRGVYLHAAATVCRDELKALDEAVDYYNVALDCFFSQPEQLDEQQLPRALMSFEAIDKVLTTKRDWKAQEVAYRDMIKRLPKGDARFFKLQVGLIDGLGEIYRSRLKQYKDATSAFELAQQLDPENKLRGGTDRAEILAELYVLAGADDSDKAIEQHARMLRSDPFKYDSYRALERIYKDTQQWDKLWCICNALKFFKKATPEELQFCDQYKPRGLVKAKTAMKPDSWAKLAHPDENRYISAIFGACWQGVAAMKAFPHKDFGIKREERRQLDGDPLMFSKLFLYLAQVLNVPLPEVYLLDDNKAADIQLANAI